MLPRASYSRIWFCPRCDYANQSTDEFCAQCRVRLQPTIVTRIPRRRAKLGWKLACVTAGVLFVIGLWVLTSIAHQHPLIKP